MPPTQATEGIKVIRELFNNVRNFFPALLQVEEVLKSLDAAESILPRLEEFKAENERLRRENSTLTEQRAAQQSEFDRFNQTLRDLYNASEVQSWTAQKKTELLELDSAIEVKKKALADATEAFEQFKTVHAMK